MRALFALLLLAALATPSDACDNWGGRGSYGYRSYARPYWHHPYYARFGYQRPYLYYRQLRSFGYAGYWGSPYAGGYHGGCGGPAYYTYYPAYVSVAPLYSRLSVVLTIDDMTARKTDKDGLPRPRSKPVGSRFLKDIR